MNDTLNPRTNEKIDGKFFFGMPWFENFPIKYIKFELLIKNKDKIIIDKFFDVKKKSNFYLRSEKKKAEKFKAIVVFGI